MTVNAALRALPPGPFVLAVSGGRDSMVLLEAAAKAIPDRITAVATFDHGTGAAATRASALVARRARALGLRVARGRASGVVPTEAAWRAARWRFLGRVAARHGARVVTAHTRDDLLETVVMRLLRGTGTRGLAAMLAPSPVARPFLALSRDEVAAWATAHDVRWIEDPTNASRRWLRARVRLDLLPAMERARPGVGAELLALARRAAAVRATLDRCAARISEVRGTGEDADLVIAARDLDGYDARALAALWPALAARLGLALDRRGTSRAATFTMQARTGGTVQLAGGFQLVRRPGAFVLRRAVAHSSPDTSPASSRRLDGAVELGRWRLRPSAPPRDDADLWRAELPADAPLVVRAWAAGDRMRAGGTARRVKRYFGDARIPGMDRAGWPVVLAGSEIVWIPGVRRSDAASDRSGRPGLWYVCERISD